MTNITFQITDIEKIDIVSVFFDETPHKYLRLPAKEGYELTWLRVDDMDDTVIEGTITSNILENLYQKQIGDPNVHINSESECK